MCGICGFVGPTDRTLLRAMTRSLVHRGPDQVGFFEDRMVSLGAQRLSIIDVEGGHQPVTNEDGTIHCVFNGEIYNFMAIRDELLQKGHRFASKSDTEVIVHAYEEFGLGAVSKFSGMFGFAVWDSRSKRLLLARDRMGMKPLYWTSTPDGIAFGSEIKSLLLRPDNPRLPNPRALRLLLTYRYVPNDETAFKNIWKLPPGHQLIWQQEGISLQEYWRLPTYETYDCNETRVIATTLSLVRDAVKSHLVSDVPIGVMLSGGIDSATVAYFANKFSSGQLATFTFGYSENFDDKDSESARLVAAALSSDHHQVLVDSEQLLDLLPLAIYHFDEPKVDPAAIPTMAASRKVRSFVKVVLVGEGSDEQFGGYPSHLYFVRSRAVARLVPTTLGQERFLKAMRRSRLPGKLVRVVQYLGSLSEPEKALLVMNSELFSQGEFNEYAEASFRMATGNENPEAVYTDVFRQIGYRENLAPSYVDLKIYVPNDICVKIDRMTMAASLEARVPFLDTRLLEYSLQIDPSLKTKWGKTKYPLRKAMRGLLPKAVTSSRKRPIAVPIAGWMRSNMDAFLSLCTSPSARQRQIFSQASVKTLSEKVKRDRDGYAAAQLFAIATVEMWYRIFIDPDSWSSQTAESLAKIW